MDSSGFGRCGCVKIDIKRLRRDSGATSRGKGRNSYDPNAACLHKSHNVAHPNAVCRFRAWLPIQAQMPLAHVRAGKFARFEKAGCKKPFVKTQLFLRGRRSKGFRLCAGARQVAPTVLISAPSRRRKGCRGRWAFQGVQGAIQRIWV